MTERREESAMKQRQERADEDLVVDLNEDSRMELLFSSI